MAVVKLKPPSRLKVLSAAAWLLPVAVLRADSLDDWVAALYRPFQAESVALAPDGRHVAYSRHENRELSVVIVSVDDPSATTNVRVETDRSAGFVREKLPVQLNYLRWFSADRIVIAPYGHLEHYPPAPPFRGYRPPVITVQPAKFFEPVYVVDLSSHSFKELVNANAFAVSRQKAMDFGTTRIGRNASEPARGSAPLTPEDDSENPPSLIVTILPRQIHFIGPAADDTNGLLLEAYPNPTSIIKVDTRSGMFASLGDTFEAGQLLCDRQGNARILYPNPAHSETRQFQVVTKGARTHLQPLGSAGPGIAASDFAVTIDNYFGHRSIPLGFDFDPKILYYASNVGRDTYGVYQLDLQSGRRTGFAVVDPHVDLAALDPEFPSHSLVFDEKRRQIAGVRGEGVAPFTLWVDREVQTIQGALELKFPGRTVEILQWDDDRDRFLVRVTGAEPGRYFIYERPEDLLVEFLRSAPWLRAADLNDAAPLEFDTPSGVHLTGYLTYPRQARVDPPPLLALFPSHFLERTPPAFDRDAQVYSAMGFAVLRVNCRGSAGFGVDHRDAILGGIDRVPIDDMLSAIDWVGRHRRIDANRVAAFGEGFGGYLALRALQLYPDRFRCALGIDAPMDLENWLWPHSQEVDFAKESIHSWLGRSRTPLADISVSRHPELLTRPVFLMVDPLGDPRIVAGTEALRSKLAHLGRPPAYFELSSEYELGLNGARSRVFHQIEDFLNLNVYDYHVRLGPLKEIK